MNELLILCDDNILTRVIKSEMKATNISMIINSNIEEGLKTIKNKKIKGVMVKLPLLSEHCPKRLMNKIRAAEPYVPIFFMLDQTVHTEVVTLMKMGAENIYVKPFNFIQIAEDISAIFTTIHQFSPQTTKLPPPATQAAVNQPKYMRANSKQAINMYKQIEKVADTNFTVIIYGETGTGKESIARRLSEGKYQDKPFVAVDCGCLNKELAASELFGHKKGSFTNAYEDKIGAFEEANNGTIFLDEIGNLDYNVQILLLRAIEEKKIKRIGSHEEIDVNVRIIVASNEKLIEAVKEGKFREDLYYRLNEFEIIIPPLRKRKDDIVPFINYFINQANRDLQKNILGVEEELLQLLVNYSWPGNIRELKNIIRRGCLMSDNYINKQALTSEFINNLHLNQQTIQHSLTHPSIDPMKQKVIETEYEQIMNVLKEENFNKTTTAIRLNMNRKTLYNKLKNYELLVKSQNHTN